MESRKGHQLFVPANPSHISKTKCVHQLRSPLAQLFTCSFDSSLLPLDWLRSYITPLFKKGSRHDPDNYRPIALTATMCKLMEILIKYQLLGFLLRKSIINKNQLGFISNHSTCTYLTIQSHYLSLKIRYPLCLYLEFSSIPQLSPEVTRRPQFDNRIHVLTTNGDRAKE